MVVSRWIAAQGERSAVRYLFRKGLEVNYRSRYVHLSWGLFERETGNVENARELFRRGHALNPLDAPILQVRQILFAGLRPSVPCIGAPEPRAMLAQHCCCTL